MDSKMPTHLTTRRTCTDWTNQEHRGGTSVESQRATSRQYFTARESRGKLTGYDKLRPEKQKSLISPSMHIYNSIKTIRPVKVEPQEEEPEPIPVPGKKNQKGKPDPKAQKAAKGKGKQPVEPEVEEEPSRDKDLEILDEPSVREEPSMAESDLIDDYTDNHRK